MKRLIFSNSKKRDKKIILLGHTILADAIAIYLKNRNIKFTYLRKNGNNDKLFFENVFLPQSILKKLGFYASPTDLRFTFKSEELLFPVINSYDFFKECYLKTVGNEDDIEKFEAFLSSSFTFHKGGINYFYKNFSKTFSEIIVSILLFYNFPEPEYLKINDIKEILKNFFSENISISKNDIEEILNDNLNDVNKSVISEDDNVIVKNSTVIVANKIMSFDVLITDFVDFVKDRKKIIYNENFIEFKINKDYITEYFPKNLIYKSKDFSMLNLCEDKDNYRKFKLRRDSNTDYVWRFFKNFFPELRESDLILEKNSSLSYRSYVFKKESYPFNFASKLEEYMKYIDKNFVQ